MENKSLITLYILFLSLLGTFSCNNNNRSADSLRNNQYDSLVTEKPPSASIKTDSLKRIPVDDYPVTDAMLEDKTNNNGSHSKKIGDVESIDKAWFTNESIGQTLVFELYTDKHRLLTYHFFNKNIPKELIEILELHVEREPAPYNLKRKSLLGFIKSATQVDARFFTTNKGIKLGDSKERVVGLYGIPAIDTISGNINCLVWNYVGEFLYDGKTDLHGAPLAKDNYGHQTTMYFENNKLVAIIFHNEIP